MVERREERRAVVVSQCACPCVHLAGKITCLPYTPTGSRRSQPHAGEKRKSEHKDTLQAAKRERLDGQCCTNVLSVLYSL